MSEVRHSDTGSGMAMGMMVGILLVVVVIAAAAFMYFNGAARPGQGAAPSQPGNSTNINVNPPAPPPNVDVKVNPPAVPSTP